MVTPVATAVHIPTGPAAAVLLPPESCATLYCTVKFEAPKTEIPLPVQLLAESVPVQL